MLALLLLLGCVDPAPRERALPPFRDDVASLNGVEDLHVPLCTPRSYGYKGVLFVALARHFDRLSVDADPYAWAVHATPYARRAKGDMGLRGVFQLLESMGLVVQAQGGNSLDRYAERVHEGEVIVLFGAWLEDTRQVPLALLDAYPDGSFETFEPRDRRIVRRDREMVQIFWDNSRWHWAWGIREPGSLTDPVDRLAHDAIPSPVVNHAPRCRRREVRRRDAEP